MTPSSLQLLPLGSYTFILAFLYLFKTVCKVILYDYHLLPYCVHLLILSVSIVILGLGKARDCKESNLDCNQGWQTWAMWYYLQKHGITYNTDLCMIIVTAIVTNSHTCILLPNQVQTTVVKEAGKMVSSLHHSRKYLIPPAMIWLLQS